MPPAFLDKLRTMIGGRTSDGAKKLVERRPRYIIESSLIYRPTGGMVWYKGTTRNFSSTGVLFQGETPVPTETTIEISITPPRRSEKKLVEGVFCWGTVVRTAAASDAPGTSLAARIDKYRTKPRFLTEADIHFERMI
jgi:hypothetical protein